VRHRLADDVTNTVMAARSRSAYVALGGDGGGWVTPISSSALSTTM
jgi:hypothetical protein